MKASAAARADKILGRDGARQPPRRTRAQIIKAIVQVALQEHEFFHCHSTLSTTMGWLLFYTARLIRGYKFDLLSPLRRSAIEIWQTGKEQFVYDSSAPALNEGRFAQAGLAEAELLWRFLNSPSPYWVEKLGKANPSSGKLISEPHTRKYPWLSQVRLPSESDLLRHREVPSLPHILEAQAGWKEFWYASALTLLSFGREPNGSMLFHCITRDFVRSRLENLKYRAVADLIAARTGHGLAKAVVGYILDIALCPPVVGDDVRWAEFHPCARLIDILRAWRDFSLPDWAGRTNVEGIPSDAYEQLDAEIAKKLGWTSALANVRALERKLIEETGPIKVSGIIRDGMMPERFMYCLQRKIACGGVFLSEFGTPRESKVRHIGSAPLTITWDDDFWVSPVATDPVLQDLLIFDTLYDLVLEALINPDSKLSKFTLARRFHARATRWMRSKPGHANLIEKSFDRFVDKVRTGKLTGEFYSLAKPLLLSPLSKGRK
jgi:hypothetical protein